MTHAAVDHPYREFERAGWERAADAYGTTFERATKLFAPALLAAGGCGKGVRILDVACATGFIAGMAAAQGALATGIDFSASMVTVARRRFPELDFRQADAEALPFADGSFDGVVIGFGVHHFPFPVRALGEARRVLRLGGRLAFTVWAAPEEHIIHKLVLGAVRASGHPSPELPAPPVGTLNDADGCRRLLADAGFAAASIRTERVEARVTVDSGAELVAMLANGTVRSSAVIRSLPADRLPDIIEAVERAAEPYREGGQLRVPAVAILAAATRTAA
jgi:SAM-dependent methyltransferase